MAARSVMEHRVRLPGSGETLVFTRRHLAEFLVPWSYMDRDIKTHTWSGPTWHYDENGRKRKASIPLTVQLADGEIAYWDFVDIRRGKPLSMAVKQAHAELEGRRYVAITSTFINSNIIEYRNRRTAFFLFVNSREAELREVEADVLVAVGLQAKTLRQLRAELSHSSQAVGTAVLSLWRQGRLEVPIGLSLFGDHWNIRRRPYGGDH
jgi:hypothetical protein